MDLTIYPGKLTGTVSAIPSKSQAHRILICAAFSHTETTIICPDTNEDIEATANCLRGLGANITRTKDGYSVIPVSVPPKSAVLSCRESGSTLRFMLPIVGALGVDATFNLHGRLPKRPLSPLWEEMERMGCKLSRPTENTIRCTGKLICGKYRINGSISSQFITGLLLALPFVDGKCDLEIEGKIESKPYIDLTLQVQSLFGYNQKTSHPPYQTPGHLTVEGDWSNAAFLLAAKQLGSNLSVTGLNSDSVQGDKAILSILAELSEYSVIDCADIPDLVPILAVVAGANKGATFKNINRLRLKESDRVQSVAAMLRELGADVVTTENEITVFPAVYKSCTINAEGDHRIAMSAAVAATVSAGPITILGAQCVSKSYPAFWDEYRRLGGHYEQHNR
jgi:3-phosphoshikimate 1-carboxyvinyltransferase